MLVSCAQTDVFDVHFGKAFDSVNQACLVKRLKSLVFDLFSQAWFDGFLTASRQRAKVGSIY